ncbi:RBR-type E3 ubiquitin transferase [Aphelenchoides besseyi]|nr:RBR-type E3 ubiquitin transferase [Aphelenchoides besseyi]
MGQKQTVFENAARTVKQPFSTDYRILDKDELYLEIEQKAAQVSEFTAFPPSVCKVLLNSFRWNCEELISRFYDIDGSFLRKHQITTSTSFRREGNKICHICLSESNTGLCLNACNHTFCFNCYRSYVETKINEQQWLIHCPENNCNFLTQDHVFHLITDGRLRELYKKAMIESYVRLSCPVLKAVKQCPTVNCSCRWQSLNADVSNFIVKGQCNNTYCFQCMTEDHWPATYPSEKWLHRNSKNCPNCQAKIEKNGGCDHMTCKLCSHEFCWICLNRRKGNHYLRDPRDRTNEYDTLVNLRNSKHYKDQLDKYVKLMKQFELAMSKPKAGLLFRWLLLLQPGYLELSTLRTAIDVLPKTRQMLGYWHVDEFFVYASAPYFISTNTLEQSANQLEKLIESRILNLTDATLNSKLDQSIATVQKYYQKLTGRSLFAENQFAEVRRNNLWIALPFCISAIMLLSKVFIFK